MRAGAMRENLTFSTLSETQTASGSVTKQWVESYSCKAMLKRVSPVYDKDGVQAKEEYQGTNQYFIVRMTSTITDKMRISYRGNWYEIILIEPIYADRTMIIQARRINE